MERGSGKVSRAGTIIFDDLAFKLTPSERIIFGIIHRFSGYNLGECRLKPNKIADLAGVSRSTVYNVTNRLIKLGMIELVIHEKKSGAKFRALRVIKDRLDDVKPATGEEIDKRESENIQPAKVAARKEYGNDEINELLNYWLEQTQIPITSRVKANRRAVWNLHAKYETKHVKQLIQIAAQAKFDDFAPRIADFVDLQAKAGQLMLWAEKMANAKMMANFEAMSIEDRVKFKEENPKLAQIIRQKRKVM